MRSERDVLKAENALRVVTMFWLCVAVGSVRAQQVSSKPMAADAHPAFEVAAIKHSDPNDGMHRFHMEGRHFAIENQTVKRLMMFAYGVNKSQITGEPEWANSEWFDVDGVPDVEGEPSVKQAQEMVRALLTDRFGLKFHREQREMPVYALTVAKGGPKLKKSQSDPNALPDQSGGNYSGIRKMKFTNNTMDELALGMQFYLDRPVVDNRSAGQMGLRPGVDL